MESRPNRRNTLNLAKGDSKISTQRWSRGSGAVATSGHDCTVPEWPTLSRLVGIRGFKKNVYRSINHGSGGGRAKKKLRIGGAKETWGWFFYDRDFGSVFFLRKTTFRWPRWFFLTCVCVCLCVCTNSEGLTFLWWIFRSCFPPRRLGSEKNQQITSSSVLSIIAFVPLPEEFGKL